MSDSGEIYGVFFLYSDPGSVMGGAGQVSLYCALLRYAANYRTVGGIGIL